MYCTKRAHVRIIVGRGASTLKTGCGAGAAHLGAAKLWCDTTGCGYNWVQLLVGAHIT